MAASDDSDGETAAPEARSDAKHRATPVKQPSYTREGITYRQLPAWHDVNALYEFRREHGKSQYNVVSDAKAHFKKLEQGSINVWAAFDQKRLVGLVSADATFVTASMLLSPLMGPIQASTLGLVVGDRRMLLKGARNEAARQAGRPDGHRAERLGPRRKSRRRGIRGTHHLRPVCRSPVQTQAY